MFDTHLKPPKSTNKTLHETSLIHLLYIEVQDWHNAWSTLWCKKCRSVSVQAKGLTLKETHRIFQVAQNFPEKLSSIRWLLVPGRTWCKKKHDICTVRVHGTSGSSSLMNFTVSYSVLAQSGSSRTSVYRQCPDDFAPHLQHTLIPSQWAVCCQIFLWNSWSPRNSATIKRSRLSNNPGESNARLSDSVIFRRIGLRVCGPAIQSDRMLKIKYLLSRMFAGL